MDEDKKTCWCPCGCGCVDEDTAPCGRLLENGLCAACANNSHEVAPEGIGPALDDLIAQHLSVCLFLSEVRKNREADKRKAEKDQ